MRVAALALLWATAACDQIFGIKLTQPWDAHGPIDAPDWQAAITWQTLAGGQITDDPIDGLAVQLGSLDGTIPLAPVDVDASGNFKVPYQLAFEPYRVAFMAPDGVPTEIQTKLKGFHYAFPSYGRHVRGTVPAGATFSGSATSSAGAAVRLLTTGLWSFTEGSAASTSNGGFSFLYQQYGVSLSGALGVPNSADGDVQVVEFGSGFAVYNASGFGNAGSAPLQTSTQTEIGVNSSYIGGADSRLTRSLGGYSSPGVQYTQVWAGAIPTTLMPSFVQPMTAGSASPPSAPVPVILPLDESGDTTLTVMNPFTGAPGQGPLLPLAVYTGDFWLRTAGSGVPTYLTSSLQSITPVSGGSAVPHYPVGIAESTTSSPITLDSISLAVDGSTVAIGSASMLPLMFAADAAADDCIVVLYRVENTNPRSLTPLARYIIVGTPVASGSAVVVDSHLLAPASVYTFGIQCEVGRDLSGGDFTQVSYPFSASTTFTALFSVD
jgi:hypothetical protein